MSIVQHPGQGADHVVLPPSVDELGGRTRDEVFPEMFFIVLHRSTPDALAQDCLVAEEIGPALQRKIVPLPFELWVTEFGEGLHRVLRPPSDALESF